MNTAKRKNPLDLFLSPGSVAVVGATRRAGKGAFNVIEQMLEFGFKGKIYPVNPNVREIAGIRTYGEIQEIKKPIDLTIIATPREGIPDILRDCAASGVRAAIIVSQGFADADDEGKTLQNEITRIGRKHAIRILGPNTLGVMNAFSGFCSSFMPLKREPVPVGVICQSGLFFVGSAVFTGMVGKGIDIGNGCDLGFTEALEYFGDDDQVKVIFIHMEGIVDGRRFLEVAKKVCLQKPVIVLKTGKAEESARAAASHSGSLVGDFQVYEAAFRQAGIISAKNPEEVMDYTKTFLHLSPLNGKRLGVVTFTGGGGIILLDALEENGLELAPLSPETIGKIKKLSPPWMPIQNPLDIWPALMKHGMKHVCKVGLQAVLEDPAVDGAICIAIAPNLPEDDYLDATDVIGDTAAAFPGKPVVVWLYGPNPREVSKKLEGGGKAMSFPTLPRAAKALAALHRWGERNSRESSSK